MSDAIPAVTTTARWSLAANSVWTNITDMYVGNFSLNNSLTISNGGSGLQRIWLSGAGHRQLTATA